MWFAAHALCAVLSETHSSLAIENWWDGTGVNRDLKTLSDAVSPHVSYQIGVRDVAFGA